MGKINQGILGGFSGRVGTVIGSNWKTVHYMRALAVSVSNPRTEKQQCQRGKFSMAISFLKAITPFVRIGFKGYAYEQSAFNAAMSYIMKNAITGCGANSSIDFDKALVSHGNLTTAMDATATVTGSKVTYAWTDNSGMGDAQTKDIVMALAYNKEKKEAVYNLNAATRSDAKAELTLPASWSNDALAIYLSFCSADGKNIANSVCLKNDAVSGEPVNPKPGEGGGSGEEEENPL